MNYEMILDTTADVFDECKITAFPVNCFAVLKHYGFKLLSYTQIRNEDPILYKMCLNYSSDAFGHEKTICYNDTNLPSRIRFTLMHELGHFLLKHTGELETNEHEANYFASNLIAPRIVMHYERTDTTDKVHNMFGLSYAASSVALSDFNKYSCRTTKRLTEYFISIQKLPSPAKEEEEKELSPEREELRIFYQTQAEMYGDDYSFQVAESQYLYGF